MSWLSPYRPEQEGVTTRYADRGNGVSTEREGPEAGEEQPSRQHRSPHGDPPTERMQPLASPTAVVERDEMCVSTARCVGTHASHVMGTAGSLQLRLTSFFSSYW